MSVQKQHSRSAYASFCPSAPLIVAGTSQWGADEGVNAQQPSLEILSLDLIKQGLELPRVGQQIPLPAPLLSLTWGSFGIATGQSKYGILAGAMANNEIALWDPTAIINKASQSATIHSWSPSTSTVNSLAFNARAPSVIGCGTAAGEVMLFDITNPRVPKQGFGDEAVAAYKPTHRGQGPSAVLALRFNTVSERIMAVGFANGSTLVYDTRKKRTVFDFFDDNSPRRASGVAWAPGHQTHLVVASEDDRSPTLQFWDLRMAKAPKMEYVGHSRGVTDVAWCPHDSRIMVSSGKDQQTLVWDTQSGERLGCLDVQEPGPAIQVAWSPISQGTFLTCQAGGAVRIANFTGTACSVESSQDQSTGQTVQHMMSRPLPSAPTWMRRRCAARFGWGGKLAIVRPPLGKDTMRSVSVSAISTEAALRDQSERFEQAMVGDLRSYCSQKMHEEGEPEAEYWSFIRVLLEGEQCETAMLSQLGFTEELAASRGPPATEQVESATALLNNVSLSSPEDDDFFGGDGGTPKSGGDFFDNLDAAETLTPHAGVLRSNMSGISESGILEQDGLGEAEIQRMLFVGNHASAVETCVAHDRLADALVIAHISGDGDLWKTTLTKYMRACPHPYLRIVESQVKDDYETLIKQRSLGKWMETLAILLTYARNDFPRLCCKLAERLKKSSMGHAATLCYICACDVDAAVSLWLQEARGAAMPVASLQRVLEKSIALGLAARQQSGIANQALAELIANYALQLVNQGCMASAMKYLALPSMVPPDSAPSLAILKDRVYKGATAECADAEPPMFPFEYIDVPVSNEGYAAQQAAYDLYYQQQQQQQYAQQQQSTPTHQQNYGQYNGASQQHQQQQQQQPFANQWGGQQALSTPVSPPTRPGYTRNADYENRRYRTDGNYGAPPVATHTQPQHYVPEPAASNGWQPPQAYSGPPQPVAPPRQQQQQGPPPSAPPVAPVAPMQRYTGPPPRVPDPVQPQAPVTRAFVPSMPTGTERGPAPTSGPPSTASAPVFQPTRSPVPVPIVPTAPPQQAGPPSHSYSAPPPAAPAAPPPPPPGPPPDVSVYNVDTSAVNGTAKMIVQQLMSLYQVCEPIAQSSMAKKREMENNANKLGILFWQLNAQQLSGDVLGLLEALAKAIGQGDFAAAQHYHVKLTGSHWDECDKWLQAIKRLMKARQTL